LARADGTDAFTAGSPLHRERTQVATALVDFCGNDLSAAALALALPKRSADEDLALNRALFDAPVTAALDRYAGTVYEALDAPRLTAAGRQRAMESVLVFSGLFGVLRAGEQVPAYRLPVAASVPTIGALTPFWRAALAAELPEALDGHLLVDLRSSDYAAMWRPTGTLRDQLVAVRVVTEQPDGRLAVVSYPSKHGKGLLARALLARRGRVTSADHVAQAWTDAGGRDATIHPDGRVELLTEWITPPARPGYSRRQP
jgi:hypothetical protein